jgi:hypothetical protein
MMKHVVLAALASTFIAPAQQTSTSDLVGAGVPRDPSSIGYLNLHKRHPDGAEGPQEFNVAYSADSAPGRPTPARRAATLPDTVHMACNSNHRE